MNLTGAGSHRRFGAKTRLGLTTVCAAWLALAASATAAPSAVHTKDGRTVVGDVIETPNSLVVRTADGVQVIPREQVLSVAPVAAAAPSTATQTGKSPATSTAPSATQPGDNGSLLNGDEINRIRQVELTADDTSVTFKFDPQAEKEFCRETGMSLGAFKALSPLQRFLAMRANGGPRTLDRVKVLRDPRSVSDFRSTLQKPLLVGCASAGCHGGPLAGNFHLVNPATDDTATYTNFYTLMTYRARPQAGGNPEVPFTGQLVDRLNPSSSLILQYGLAATETKTPHPKVAGFKAVYKNRDDDRYVRALNWITDTLPPLVNGYGIPTPASASQPAATTRSAAHPEGGR